MLAASAGCLPVITTGTPHKLPQVRLDSQIRPGSVPAARRAKAPAHSPVSRKRSADELVTPQQHAEQRPGPQASYHHHRRQHEQQLRLRQQQQVQAQHQQRLQQEQAPASPPQPQQQQQQQQRAPPLAPSLPESQSPFLDGWRDEIRPRPAQQLAETVPGSRALSQALRGSGSGSADEWFTFPSLRGGMQLVLTPSASQQPASSPPAALPSPAEAAAPPSPAVSPLLPTDMMAAVQAVAMQRLKLDYRKLMETEALIAMLERDLQEGRRR